MSRRGITPADRPEGTGRSGF
ncbi:hypothetical protein C1366_24370 [Salmonella enterica]|nr:hypothetical protein [Salmonella enterica]EBO0017767.1 hypothetical protein [Salmonella enterica]EDX6463316.1 hypothetical protein [Salmonella enterica subsp. diarizonae serovar 60:r:e,n,x,z15]